MKNEQEQQQINNFVWSASVGDLQAVKAYILIGIDVNAQNFCGTTALIEAAHSGHLDIVKKLLTTLFIDAESTDRHGNNAKDLALKKGHMQIYKLIQEYANARNKHIDKFRFKPQKTKENNNGI